MGKKSKTTIGYKYFMGIHMSLSRGPLDEIVEIRVGDKEAWKGSITGNTEITIDKPDLFGGEEKEGGIQGTLAVLMGAKTQPVHARLAAMLGGLVPAFRGVTTTFFDGLICAMSPYPKTWAYRVRRSQQGWHSDATWYPAKARVLLEGGAIHAMNPAHILYQAYTDPRMGRGLPASRLDDASWQAAADLFAAEGFGLCLKWTRSDGIDKFAQSVLDHVGASVFTSRRTGKIVLWPTRDNYNVDDLQHFTFDTGLLGIDDDDTASQMGGTNEVVVKFKDPVDKQDKQVRAKNLGAIHAAGGVTNSTSLDMFGLPTASLASRVAQRELRVTSGFIRRFKLRLDRRGADIMPGGVFVISDTRRGIARMVLRAGACEYGTLGDGTVTITAVQDVFGLPATSLTAVEPPGFIPPSTSPQPITLQRTVESSYRDLAQALGQDAQTLPATSGYLTALAVRPSGMSQGFSLMTRVGPAPFTVREVESAFCESGTLAAPMNLLTRTVPLMGARLADIDVGSAALVNDEILRVDAVDVVTGQVTFGRGCSDTVPALHAAGARVWFYEDAFGRDATEYSSGITVDAKLLTRTSTGTLAESAAAQVSLTFARRAARPYPPGRVRINDRDYSETVSGYDELVFSWAHRNRLTQADQLIDTSMASIGPEAGTSYTLSIFNAASNSLLKRIAGISGTSASIAPAEMVGVPAIRAELYAMRGELASLQWHQLGLQRVDEAGEPIGPGFGSAAAMENYLFDGERFISAQVMDGYTRFYSSQDGQVLEYLGGMAGANMFSKLEAGIAKGANSYASFPKYYAATGNTSGWYSAAIPDFARSSPPQPWSAVAIAGALPLCMAWDAANNRFVRIMGDKTVTWSTDGLAWLTLGAMVLPDLPSGWTWYTGMRVEIFRSGGYWYALHSAGGSQFQADSTLLMRSADLLSWTICPGSGFYSPPAGVSEWQVFMVMQAAVRGSTIVITARGRRAAPANAPMRELVLHSSDRLNFSLVYDADAYNNQGKNDFFDVKPVGSGGFVATGLGGLLVSADDGLTWSRTALSPAPTALRSSGQVVVGTRATGANGASEAWRTVDGLNWTKSTVRRYNTGQHRHWRLRAIKTAGEVTFGYLAFFGGAAKLTGYAKSQGAGTGLANVDDADAATFWSAPAAQVADGSAWVAYDFGSAQDVTAVELQAPSGDNNRMPSIVEIEASEDGVNWRPVWFEAGLTWSAGESKTLAKTA